MAKGIKSKKPAIVLPIVRLGHPTLRAHSKAVTKKELISPKFQRFLDNLQNTCMMSNGVGIAAPQVNVNKRVIVVYVDPKNPRYPDKQPFPLTIVINPKITKIYGKVEEDWEGDLSCSLRAMIPRRQYCEVTGYDRTGVRICFNLDYSFHARIFMHEIDHLNGIFNLDHVVRKETICEQDEWEKYWKPKNK